MADLHGQQSTACAVSRAACRVSRTKRVSERASSGWRNSMGGWRDWIAAPGAPCLCSRVTNTWLTLCPFRARCSIIWPRWSTSMRCYVARSCRALAFAWPGRTALRQSSSRCGGPWSRAAPTLTSRCGWARRRSRTTRTFRCWQLCTLPTWETGSASSRATSVSPVRRRSGWKSKTGKLGYASSGSWSMRTHRTL